MPTDFITIVDLIQRTADFFAKKGIESAKTDAEWLIAHVLGCKRLDLYLRFDQMVPEDKLATLRDLVRRRGTREPLQQILGFVEWGNLRLSVDRHCLVPRSETEELWDAIVRECQVTQTEPTAILDLGTGSGALALALKKSFPAARVVAVDRNADTLALAKENAAAHSLDVEFIQSDWFENVPTNMRFDLIVSNPPYLTAAEWESAAPEVKDWEPREALTAPNDGLADLLSIIENAHERLADGGQLWLEHGIAHDEALAQAAKKLGYSACEHYKDSQHRTRFTKLVR